MSVPGRRAALGAGALLLTAAVTSAFAATATVPAGLGVDTPSPASAAGLGAGTSDGAIAGRVSVSPVTVRLEMVRRGPKSKAPIEVRATVLNLSDSRLSAVVLTLRSTPSLAVRPAGPTTLRRIAAGGTVDEAWFLCTTVAGSFVITASAVVGAIPTESSPLTVTLGASTRC